MLVTSKEANKMLNELESKYRQITSKEAQTRTFLASVSEDIESCRPEYDYSKTQDELKNIEDKIIKIKHAINKFNTETVVEGFNKTIDEMLIYIPQLTKRLNKLDSMQSTFPKVREISSLRSNIIDYRYANYDIKKAEKDYSTTEDELHKAQIALDKVNVSLKFEIDN